MGGQKKKQQQCNKTQRIKDTVHEIIAKGHELKSKEFQYLPQDSDSWKTLLTPLQRYQPYLLQIHDCF